MNKLSIFHMSTGKAVNIPDKYDKALQKPRPILTSTDRTRVSK